jgi:heat shock protein HtpX
MKRIVLFVLTNLAVMLVLYVALSIIMPLLGIRPEQGGMAPLLVFAAVFGMGGAFISLAMSKWTAKRMVGAQVIDQPRNDTETWLLNTVRRQAELAGIGMPEVAIYDAPDVNAFATGMSRNNALVAVSSGLLRAMSRDEAEAVLGHEISHIANGDMVTLTLLQGVLNTFVIVLSRLVGQFIDRAVFRNENGHGAGFFIATMVAQLLFGVLASVIVMWFSRQREFRADRGGATLAGRGKMIAALQRLQAAHEPAMLPEQLAAFGIAGNKGIARLFMSHPPLEERIAALQQAG